MHPYNFCLLSLTLVHLKGAFVTLRSRSDCRELIAHDGESGDEEEERAARKGRGEHAELAHRAGPLAPLKPRYLAYYCKNHPCRQNMKLENAAVHSSHRRCATNPDPFAADVHSVRPNSRRAFFKRWGCLCRVNAGNYTLEECADPDR